jgi:hypothetical protein
MKRLFVVHLHPKRGAANGAVRVGVTMLPLDGGPLRGPLSPGESITYNMQYGILGVR